MKACLLAGKHVTTSNKALVAAHGTELLEIAREKKVNFFFEAAVGGGIPVIRNIGTGYAGQVIEEVTGILNGTTNFILTKMDREGASFADVLAEAQRLGYAEKDPSADVEGWDTCRKIAILSSLVMDGEVDFEEIETEGITKIDTADFAYARKMGTSIRLGAKSVTQLEMMPEPPCKRLDSNPWPEWPRVGKTDYGQEEAIRMFGHDPRIYQTTVKEFHKNKNGELNGITVISLEAKRDPETGRMQMVPVEGTEKKLPAQLVLIAAGFLGSQDYVTKDFGVEVDGRTNVKTGQGDHATTVPGIYAAGDMHIGQSLVVRAIAEGRAVAKQVDEALMG